MVIGYILTALGIMGSVFMGTYMANDRRYNYSAPLTDHETIVLTLFVLCIVMLAVGVITIIFAVVKKKNEDELTRINNMGQSGKMLGVCPNCGLNISKGTCKCPKCGTVIK